MTRSKTTRLTLSGAASLIALSLAAGNAWAEEKQFDIEAQPLAKALLEFNEQSGLTVAAPRDLVQGKSAPAVRGAMEPDEALEKILSGSGLKSNELSTGAFTITLASVEATEPAPEPFRVAQLDQEEAVREVEQRRSENDEEDRQDVIVVTGTNIRGIAPDSSPSIVLDREAIQSSGFQSTDQLIRSIPQTFGGGANQLSARVPDDAEASSNNINGSSVNLRGLGGGSTLVLLNGRRLAPAGASGSFVDISMLPISALERVEVLTDGASAIYGADAVAGVVNFVLRDDFEGLETTLNHGLTTEGDLNQLRATQTVGGSWGSGNALASYEYFDRDGLLAEDKEFASAAPPSSSLAPSQERHSLVFVGKQTVSDTVDFSIHGNYVNSDSVRFIDFGQVGEQTTVSEVSSEQYLVSPSIEVMLAGDWRLLVAGDYGRVIGERETAFGAGGTAGDRNEASQWSADILVDGAVFTLPGGAVRAALGASYRDEDFVAEDIDGVENTADRIAKAVFGEVYIPIVGNNNAVPGMQRLELSAAARYDDYSDFGDTLNPKIGILWSPVQSLNFRASYGTSFNPPNLGDLGSVAIRAVTVFLPDPQSATGSSSSLVTLGGVSANLNPEKSRSFSAGFDYEAPLANGVFSLSSTYYDISFDDRIGNVPLPTGGPFQSLVNRSELPDEIIVGNPSAALVQSVLDRAQATTGILDLSGGALNASSQFDYFLDFNRRNLALTETSGIDFDIGYALDSELGTYNVGLAGDYIIEFKEQAASTTPVFDSVDTIFNPAALRLRGSFNWTRNEWAVASYLNYTSSYEDDRATTPADVDSFVTLDLTASYDFSETAADGLLKDTRLSLSVLNLLDQDPPFVASDVGLSAITSASFDPANASPLGRFVSLQVTKQW